MGCTTKDIVTEKTEPTTKEIVQLEFPKDYKHWTHGTSKIILDKTSPLYGFQQIFVNDKALDTYKKGGDYPDGSTLLLAFYEPIMEEDTIIQGDILWYAAMEKDSTAEKTGGWIFDGFDGNTLKPIIDDPVTGCYICHTAKKDKDFVFTQFEGKVILPEEPVEIDPDSYSFPTDFRSWHHSNSRVVLDENSPLYGFQQIYVNDIGFETKRTGGIYPDDSQLVIAFYEPIDEDDTISQGDILWYAAMKKDSTAEKTGGWIYDGFDSETLQSKIDDPVTGCYVCHAAVKDNDYVFSKYVP
jgi:hypothetical protein